MAEFERTEQEVTNEGGNPLGVDAGTTGTEQHLENDVISGIKGTLILGSDGTNAKFIKVDSSGKLQIDINSLPSIIQGTSPWIISGTVQQGTPPWQVQSNSLNLATENTLNSIKTSIEIIDDWDELDRAKVNLIIGQVGIAGGSGIDASNVPRISLATDVSLPSGVNRLGDIRLLDHLDANLDITRAISLPSTARGLLPVAVENSTGFARELYVISDRDLSSIKRLQVEAEFKPGQVVTLASSAPANATLIFSSALLNVGSPNMLVNGTLGSPIDFIVNSDPTQDIIISELRLVFSTNSFVYNGNSFGSRPALTNGILFDLIVNNGQAATLLTAKLNEDLLRFASSTGLNVLTDRTQATQLLITSFIFGGNMRLKAGTSDRIRIRIRDNLTHVSYTYLTGTVYGQKV